MKKFLILVVLFLSACKGSKAERIQNVLSECHWNHLYQVCVCESRTYYGHIVYSHFPDHVCEKVLEKE